MKVTWEAADIHAGQIVGKPDRAERWMVGYFAAGCSTLKYVLVSRTDGCIQHTIGLTAAMVADHLNSAGELPEALLPPESD